MLAWMIRRKLDAFEHEYDYDMSYARELLDTSVSAMMTFHQATRLGVYRDGAPKDAWHAARIVSMLREDCGPCLQLAADLAKRDGRSASMVRGVLQNDLDALTDDVRLSVEFSHAVLDRDPAADALRRQVLERWGRRGLVSLAFAMLSSKLYPTLKYALGYGHACSVVHVDGAPVHMLREAH